MTAKSKNPYPFKVGDAACVRDIRSGRIVDNGVIHEVLPGKLWFKTTLGGSELTQRKFWAYRRKGTNWVEHRKDHFHLVVLS